LRRTPSPGSCAPHQVERSAAVASGIVVTTIDDSCVDDRRTRKVSTNVFVYWSNTTFGSYFSPSRPGTRSWNPVGASTAPPSRA
jgi:hypothetical protein